MNKYLTKYEYRWALIFSLVYLLWATMEYEYGWHSPKGFYKHTYFTYLFILPAAITYFLFLFDKRKHRFRKRFKFKHAFLSCLSLTGLITLFNIPLQLFSHSIISPNYLPNLNHHLNNVIGFNTSLEFSIYSAMVIFPMLIFFMGLFLTFLIASMVPKK